MQRYFAVILAFCLLFSAMPAEARVVDAGKVKVTTLSTMLADDGFGEWGYSALVEVDGRKILFDTGARPEVVLRNAEELGIDLSQVEDVVISHFHGDHTGGLLTLRRAMMARNPKALSRLHVGTGIFEERYAKGIAANRFIATAAAYRETGAVIVEHAAPAEIMPGAWFGGPVRRIYDERNVSPGLFLRREGIDVPDSVPEDSSLIIPTHDGAVIVTGCGHAGIMNIAEQARVLTGRPTLLAVIGGIHLFDKPDSVLVETAARLKGLRYLLGGHCTGVEVTVRLRELLGLDRRTAVVEAVGSTFTLGTGIDPGRIAGRVG